MTPVQLPEVPATSGKTLDDLIAARDVTDPGLRERIEARYQELRAEYDAMQSPSETNSER